MGDVLQMLLAPTVSAAIVSAAALILREILVRHAQRRDGRARLDLDKTTRRDDHVIEQTRVLLQQIQLLWSENAALKRREAECEARYRDLERRCRVVERQCDLLRRRLDRFGRIVTPAREGATSG